ncbi:unnamed protein product [Lymnaea stagnalis]|uniref:Large ribosomal subunit protein mL50 n=1 Tax=Lymnaea stagnalis TaxID=6523 RepID=A0AAV2HVQ3_LYMST
MAASIRVVLCFNTSECLTHLINCQPQCSKIFTRNASWTGFFKKSKGTEGQEIETRRMTPLDGPTTVSRLESLKKKTVSCSIRGYKPPHDVENKVLTTANVIIGKQVEPSYNLSDRLIKFQLLTKLMTELDHPIPNTELSTMNTLDDVVRFFSTPVHDSSTYEDMAKLNLPKNVHIQLEPIRFDPETDTFFDGKTAFPGRPTIVTSLKYSRKYKGHSGESRNARSLTNFEKEKQLQEDAEKMKFKIK